MAGRTTTRDVVEEARARYAAAGKQLADARAKVEQAKTPETRRKLQQALAKTRSDWNDARVEVLRAESDETSAGTMTPASSTATPAS